MRNPQTPLGYAQFCDDIRREIGNKTSILGIYSGLAVFDTEFPISLPKFCIAVNWIQHRDDERRPVKIKVLLEMEDSEELVIDGDLPVEGFDAAPRVSPDDELIHAVIHIALAPLVVESPGKLKVRAYYGDDEYRLGSLRLMKSMPADA